MTTLCPRRRTRCDGRPPPGDCRHNGIRQGGRRDRLQRSPTERADDDDDRWGSRFPVPGRQSGKPSTNTGSPQALFTLGGHSHHVRPLIAGIRPLASGFRPLVAVSFSFFSCPIRMLARRAPVQGDRNRLRGQLADDRKGNYGTTAPADRRAAERTPRSAMLVIASFCPVLKWRPSASD